jgi:hypothetical protein
VEKVGDGKWHKVEEAYIFGEDYKKYNRTVIGWALVLSKLEEATKLWATMSEESFKGAKCSYVDAAGAFDKKMGDVIYHWRCHLCDAKLEWWKTLRGNDDTMYTMAGRVTRYIETFMAK